MDYDFTRLAHEAIMGITFTIDADGWERLKQKVLDKIGPVGQGKILDTTAAEGLVEIVKLTPQVSGDTRRHWFIKKMDGAREIFNNSPVMKYLEEGTKDHGPAVAAFLWFKNQSGSLIRTRWVRGIAARNIVKDYLPNLKKVLIATCRKAVKQIQNGQ